MSLCSAVHARAWLLEEVESCLSQQSGAVLDWVANYLLHLWRGLTLKQLIFEAAFILPAHNLEHFFSFLAHNYRTEFCSALTELLRETVCVN